MKVQNETKTYLKLCKDFLDVSEATLCHVQVLLVGFPFEDWLGSIVKKFGEWEKLLDF